MVFRPGNSPPVRRYGSRAKLICYLKTKPVCCKKGLFAPYGLVFKISFACEPYLRTGGELPGRKKSGVPQTKSKNTKKFRGFGSVTWVRAREPSGGPEKKRGGTMV